MVEHIVKFIRKHYGEEVPIIIRVDAGFFDQKLFQGFEKLKIGYICSGRIYEEFTTLAEQAEASQWGQYRNHQKVWDYLELGDAAPGRRFAGPSLPAGGRGRQRPLLRPAAVHLLHQFGYARAIDQRPPPGQHHNLEAEGIIAITMAGA
jgi:hypothetical protein